MKTTITMLAVLSLFVNTAFISLKNNAPLKSEYTFRIELCSFTDRVPVKTVELLREVGNVSVKKENNRSIYLTEPFNDLKTAQLELPKYKEFGFENAKEIVEINNRIITVDEYLIETKQKDKEVIRIYED